MNTKQFLATLAGASICATSLHAQCPSDRLTAQNNQNGDRFGTALSAFGSDLLVGASRDDDAGNNAGTVRRFELTDTGYVEVESWSAFDALANESFGSSVALGDGIAAVGATGLNAGTSGEGAIYLFERSGGVWTAGPRLISSSADSDDDYGVVVALSDDRIAVGAPQDEGTAGIGSTGTVTIFERNGSSWVEVQVLQPGDLASGDRFGSGLDIEGDRLVVGAPGTDGPSEAGAVYVFDHDGSSFVQSARLLPSTAGVGRRMGSSVALQGDTFVTGATGPVTGRAYVFERQGTGLWTEEAELFGSSSSGVNFFGESVDFEGDQILIGASNQSGTGASYLFERNAGSWVETANPLGEVSGDDFGIAVALDSGRLFVGASTAAGSGGPTLAGAVFLYETEGVDCNGNGQPDACDLFSGSSVDANDNGVPDECECNATSYCSSSPNSTGGAATIELIGSTSIADNDVTLRATPVPNNMFGIFYYGPSQVDLAFGNGRRCVGGQVFRLPPTLASGGGIEFDLDLTAPPAPEGQIEAGSQWNFQAWFRDPQGGGAGFDLSDGLSISFCP